jgi:hypothetical protein
MSDVKPDFDEDGKVLPDPKVFRLPADAGSGVGTGRRQTGGGAL